MSIDVTRDAVTSEGLDRDIVGIVILRNHPPGGWYPEERLPVADAVRAYTLDAAYAGGTDHLLGSLTPGKLADLVLLDRDLFTSDPQTIPQTRVTATVVGGEVVAGAL